MNYADTQTAIDGDKPTFLDPMHRAEGSVDELVKRAMNLADRLCGSVPTPLPTQGSKPGLVSSAIFDDIASTGERLHSKLGEAHDALNRIERNLP